MSRTSAMLNSTGGRDLAYNHLSVPTSADIAALNPLVYQARPASPEWREPFAYYKVLLDTNHALGSSENDEPCNNSGNTCASCCSGDQRAYCVGEQTNGEGRAHPNSVAVRFTSRSNGLPLPTIIEKGSHSTLHSHGSLVRITRRCPLGQPCNNTPSVLHSHMTSRNLDGTGLQGIQEHANHRPDADETIDDDASLHVGPAMSCSGCSSDVPITAATRQPRPSEASQLPEVDNDSEWKGLKGRLREVIQHVRGASRHSETRSSVLGPPSADTSREQEDPTRGLSPHTEDQNGESICQVVRQTGRVSATTESPKLPLDEGFETWVEDCERSLSDADTSPHDHPTIQRVPPSTLGPSDELPLIPRPLSSPLHPILHDEDPTSTTSTVRDRVQSQSFSEAPTLPHRFRDNYSTRYTIDGTPILRSNAPSLYEYDRAREVSFCGTASTTYSSTVLGIDLDLQQEYFPKPCRSRSPICFSCPASDQSQQNAKTTPPAPQHSPPRTITSSALPRLLPLATASGIVQPNLASGQLSFYSPSGNLIQARRSSTSSSPDTSYYRVALSVSEPAARPTAVALTTPFQTSMPLPGRLKQKQQHHARPHIVPQTVMPSRVKGCDGFIRTNSFTPRSGVRCSPSIRKSHKSNQSYSKGFRSRFFAVASCTSLQKGSRIHKGKTSNKSDLKSRLNRRSGSGLGPLAGRTFRVCFCQPKDGTADSHAGDDIGCLRETFHDDAKQGVDEASQVPARVVVMRHKGRNDSGVGI